MGVHRGVGDRTARRRGDAVVILRPPSWTRKRYKYSKNFHEARNYINIIRWFDTEKIK
jgi:hypothetical protein